MTPDEAIAEVNSRAAGRTRFEGSPPRYDEILMEEIQKLRDENANLAAACRIADRKNEALHDLLIAASGTHEFLNAANFADWAAFTEANIHRVRLGQAIEKAKAAMK